MGAVGAVDDDDDDDDAGDAFLALKQYFAWRLEAGGGGDGGHWQCKCYSHSTRMCNQMARTRRRAYAAFPPSNSGVSIAHRDRVC